MAKAVSTENPERARRELSFLGVSRVARHELRGRTPTVVLLAKTVSQSRKPITVFGGRSRSDHLPSRRSPGRETGPETFGPQGPTRNPQGGRERLTGRPSRGVASAPQGATGSGLRAGTGWKGTSPDGFGRSVGHERSEGRSYRRSRSLGAGFVGTGTPREGASFLGVSRVPGPIAPLG